MTTARGATGRLGATAVAALVLAGCVASPGPTPSPTVVPPSAVPTASPRATIPPEAALAAAAAFLGEPIPGAGATPPQPDQPRPIYVVDAAGATLFVDAFDGTVTGWTKGDFVPQAGPDVPSQHAVGQAVAFLNGHGIVPPAVTPTVERLDHGSLVEWSVRWQVRAGPALAPDLIHVGVDAASGTVFSMLRVRRDYVLPPVARIGRDEAIDRARAAAGMPEGILVAADLAIDFAADGTQLLVWRVQLDAGENAYGAAWVDVDAMTGAARITGQG